MVIQLPIYRLQSRFAVQIPNYIHRFAVDADPKSPNGGEGSVFERLKGLINGLKESFVNRLYGENRCAYTKIVEKVLSDGIRMYADLQSPPLYSGNVGVFPEPDIS